MIIGVLVAVFAVSSVSAGVPFSNVSIAYAPWDIAFSTTGHLFVAGRNSTGPNQIHKCTAAFSLISSWSADTCAPLGIAVDGDGNILFGCFLDTRIIKLSGVNGTLLASWIGPTSVNDIAVDDAFIYISNADGDTGSISKLTLNGVLVGTYVTTGFVNTRGVSVDSAGNIYASTQRAIVKMRNTGEIVAVFTIDTCAVSQ